MELFIEFVAYKVLPACLWFPEPQSVIYFNNVFIHRSQVSAEVPIYLNKSWLLKNSVIYAKMLGSSLYTFLLTLPTWIWLKNYLAVLNSG